jgi:hypothetical protein
MLSLSSRNHVPITYREIESHDDNARASDQPQSGKETELFELKWWLLLALLSPWRTLLS